MVFMGSRSRGSGSGSEVVGRDGRNKPIRSPGTGGRGAAAARYAPRGRPRADCLADADRLPRQPVPGRVAHVHPARDRRTARAGRDDRHVRDPARTAGRGPLARRRGRGTRDVRAAAGARHAPAARASARTRPPPPRLQDHARGRPSGSPRRARAARSGRASTSARPCCCGTGCAAAARRTCTRTSPTSPATSHCWRRSSDARRARGRARGASRCTARPSSTTCRATASPRRRARRRSWPASATSPAAR